MRDTWMRLLGRAPIQQSVDRLFGQSLSRFAIMGLAAYQVFCFHSSFAQAGTEETAAIQSAVAAYQKFKTAEDLKSWLIKRSAKDEVAQVEGILTQTTGKQLPKVTAGKDGFTINDNGRVYPFVVKSLARPVLVHRGKEYDLGSQPTVLSTLKDLQLVFETQSARRSSPLYAIVLESAHAVGPLPFIAAAAAATALSARDAYNSELLDQGKVRLTAAQRACTDIRTRLTGQATTRREPGQILTNQAAEHWTAIRSQYCGSWMRQTIQDLSPFRLFSSTTYKENCDSATALNDCLAYLNRYPDTLVTPIESTMLSARIRDIRRFDVPVEQFPVRRNGRSE